MQHILSLSYGKDSLACLLEKFDNGDMTYEQFASMCKNILEENDGD